MVTQLLFGDSFQLLEETEKWALIKVSYDGYECWVDKKQFARISESEYNEHISSTHPLSTEAVSIISIDGSNQVIPIVLGSSLPFLKNGKCRIGDVTYTFEAPSLIPGKPSRNALVENALLYLNSPYLWGGRSPFGIDCSGFSQIIYKLSGLKILRDASEQAQQGRALSFVEEAQPGDLAFFDNEEGRIVHVGIMLSTEQIVHASGKVRIDLLDHNGIYNNELKKYTHRLRVLKSYL